MGYFKALSKPDAYSKKDYMDLLGMMYTIFKLVRTKGWLAVEGIENPHDSSIFKNFRAFLKQSPRRSVLVRLSAHYLAGQRQSDDHRSVDG